MESKKSMGQEFISFLGEFAISMILLAMVFIYQVSKSGMRSMQDIESFFYPVLFVYMTVALLKFTWPEGNPSQWGILWNKWYFKYLFLGVFSYAMFVDLSRISTNLDGWLTQSEYYAKMKVSLAFSIWFLLINELFVDIWGLLKKAAKPKNTLN